MFVETIPSWDKVFLWLLLINMYWEQILHLVHTQYIKKVIIPTDGNKQPGWIYWWNLYPYGNDSSVGKTNTEHIIMGEASFTKKCGILCMCKRQGADLVLGLRESLQKEMTFELRFEEIDEVG